MSKVTESRDPIAQEAMLAGGPTVATRDAAAAVAARPVIGNADRDDADGNDAGMADSDQVLLDLWNRYKKLWQELDRLGRDEDTVAVREKIAVCGEQADRIERQILSRPASGLSGIAVKLRLILEIAPPPDSWDAEHEMIASALADAERLAGASWASAPKKSA